MKAKENKNTVRCTLDIKYYMTPYMWVNTPEEYKLLNSLSKFKLNSKELGMQVLCLLIMPYL